MAIFARIVRFLFWLFVLSWSMRLLRLIVGRVLRDAGASASSGQNAPASGVAERALTARRLVRDPVCGMHVDETLSIPLREGGELHHFCSISCRDAFALKVRKFAANG
jgi:YHS domain-containing protein